MAEEQEIINLEKILSMLKKDTRDILNDLIKGVKAISVMALLTLGVGMLAVLVGYLILYPISPPAFLGWIYLIIGVFMCGLGIWVSLAYRRLAHKYSWLLEAEKSLRK